MNQPLREHYAKVLNEWVDHYVSKSTTKSKAREGYLIEEQIQLRIAKAVEEDRRQRDTNDWGGGFGQPTAEEQYAFTLKRMRDEAVEAARELKNNLEMQEYIREITKNDVGA